MSDLLENARDPNGKILNAIDLPASFPVVDSILHPLSFATDVVAWDYVRGKPYCGSFTNFYPVAHMRWGLAGNANSISFLHIDSDGFSTVVQVISGKKVWGIYREDRREPLSSTEVFINPQFSLNDLSDESTFGLEAIVLRPGDTL